MDKMEVQSIATNPSPAESSEDLEIIYEPKDVERTTPSELADYTEMEGMNDNEDNSDLDAEELEDIATNPSPAESNEDVQIIFETPKVAERPAPSFEGLNDKKESADSYAEELDQLLATGGVKRTHPKIKNVRCKKIKQDVTSSEDEGIIDISSSPTGDILSPATVAAKSTSVPNEGNNGNEDIATNPSPAESNEDIEIIFETPKVSERPAPNFEGLNNKDFPTKIVRKPKENPQVLEQIKRECPRGVPIKAKPCKVHIPKRKAKLFNLLKRKCPRREPIVGLNEILEIEETPKGNDFSYDCLACGLNFSEFEIIKHLISLKHRTEYLNVIDYPGLEIVYGDCPRVKNLVKKMCIEVQRCEGMGKPAVIKIIYPKGMSGQAEKSGTSN